MDDPEYRIKMFLQQLSDIENGTRLIQREYSKETEKIIK